MSSTVFTSTAVGLPANDFLSFENHFRLSIPRLLAQWSRLGCHGYRKLLLSVSVNRRKTEKKEKKKKREEEKERKEKKKKDHGI